MPSSEPEGWFARVRGRLNEQPAEVRFGHYVIEGELGSGGAGVVYRARDEQLKRPVALKVLRDAGLQNPKVVERFHREALSVAKLRHPNIVVVYDAGSVDSVPYLAMELVDGEPLSAILERRALGLRELIGILARVAGAVHYAHEQGIVHRDLKPGNVLVDRAREPHVVDFGIAHREGSTMQLTQTGAVLGTPLYMAPEQVRGDVKAVGTRTDVYALGVVLYEMLTRRTPFRDTTLAGIYASILKEDPPQPRRVDPSVPAELEAVCEKAMRKEASHRYATAQELAEDLKRWLRGEPVQARPVTPWRRFASRVRRNRAVAGLSVALVLALAGGGIFAVVQRARQSLREEAVRRLAGLWSTIVQRKMDVRLDRIAPEEGRRDLSASVRAVDRYIEEWPDEPDGYYVRARGRLYLNDFEGAERDVRFALSRRADFRLAWSLLGMIRVVHARERTSFVAAEEVPARLAEAAELLREAEAAFAKAGDTRDEEEAQRWGMSWSREDETMATLARARRLRFAEDSRDAARRLLEEAYRSYRAEEYALLIAQWCERHEDQIVWYTRAIEAAPGFEAAYYERGRVRADQGEAAAAIADFDRAIELRSGFAPYHFSRAMARFALGNWEGSRQDCDRVIQLDPHSAPAYNNRGNATRMMGDLRGALLDYDRAIEINRRHWRAHLNRGKVKVRLGDLKGALAEFDRVIEIEPGDAEAHRLRGVTRADLKDLPGALADYDRAIELNDGSAEVFLKRGVARTKTGDRAGATADFDRAIEIDRGCAGAYYGRGLLKEEAGDPSGAFADYDRAIEVDGRHSEAYNMRGHIKYGRRDWAGALLDFSRAIDCRSDNVEAWMNRGLAHLRLSEWEKAVADLERALHLAPQDWPYRKQCESRLSAARRKVAGP